MHRIRSFLVDRPNTPYQEVLILNPLEGNQRVSHKHKEAEMARLPEQKYPLSGYSDLFFLKNGSNRSIGIGKRMVELLSAETSLRV